MDLRSLSTLFLFAVHIYIVSATGVLKVHYKFAGRERSLNALKAHDSNRHRRILSAVDLPLGGDGHPANIGLYFTKIGIGTPKKDYFVQVDTGSDIMWVNCIKCDVCPRKSDLNIVLKLYDPDSSKTSELVTCDQDFCSDTFEGPIPGCTKELRCLYSVMYGDGSSTTGYYVRDIVHYKRVSGDLLTNSANASVIFGCAANRTGDLSSNDALDGILGFGQSNSSMISQLASSGKVKKMFSHCLDAANGGGIFGIGRVLHPKVNTTPLVPNQPHYNVNLKAIEVGKVILDLPTDVFETGDRKGTIIDSGTTLAYLPEVVYQPLITAIMSRRPNLALIVVEGQYSCFQYTGRVDKDFSTVTFHFEDSLSLTVHPHEYLFQIRGDIWCIGWQNSGLAKDGKHMTLLGDLVLSNKLVVYDLENQVIGWTEHNCNESIKLQDENSKAGYRVSAHDLSSACSLNVGRVIILLLLTAMFRNFI